MFARVAWGKVKPGTWQAYEQSKLYQRLVDQARAYYVGEYWVKHFEVRLGEELKR